MDSVGWYVGGLYAYVGIGAVAVLFLALALALVRGHRRMRALEERLDRAERAERAEGAERAEHPPAEPSPSVPVAPAAEEDDDALVPTPLGSREDLEPTERIDREMFWDLVLRESVVRAAAVGHGLRAVLDPRTRNRIRFEVKQEIKRARKQRRSEERAAVRQLRQDRSEDSPWGDGRGETGARRRA